MPRGRTPQRVTINGVEYVSAQAAADALGVSRQTISNIDPGRRMKHRDDMRRQRGRDDLIGLPPQPPAFILPGAAHGRAVLTEAEARQILASYRAMRAEGWRRSDAISELQRQHPHAAWQTIRMLVERRSWKHLDGE